MYIPEEQPSSQGAHSEALQVGGWPPSTSTSASLLALASVKMASLNELSDEYEIVFKNWIQKVSVLFQCQETWSMTIAYSSYDFSSCRTS